MSPVGENDRMLSGRLVLTRAPRPILQPFVEMLWGIDATTDIPPTPVRREHVLPTGQMHVAFRFGGPLRLFEGAADTDGQFVGDAVVGGARDVHYIRDVSTPACSCVDGRAASY